MQTAGRATCTPAPNRAPERPPPSPILAGRSRPATDPAPCSAERATQPPASGPELRAATPRRGRPRTRCRRHESSPDRSRSAEQRGRLCRLPIANSGADEVPERSDREPGPEAPNPHRRGAHREAMPGSSGEPNRSPQPARSRRGPGREHPRQRHAAERDQSCCVGSDGPRRPEHAKAQWAMPARTTSANRRRCSVGERQHWQGGGSRALPRCGPRRFARSAGG